MHTLGPRLAASIALCCASAGHAFSQPDAAAVRLAQQTTAAAERGDCHAARITFKHLSARDPDYAATLLASPVLERCGVTPSSEERRWYGYELLLTDAAGFGLLAGGLDNDPIFLAGLATYALGPPTAHALHGNWANAAKSLGFRLGLPVFGALVGAAIDSGEGAFDFGYGPVGLLAGMIAASALDAGALGYESKPATSGSVSVAVTPNGAAALGWSGAF